MQVIITNPVSAFAPDGRPISLSARPEAQEVPDEVAEDLIKAGHAHKPGRKASAPKKSEE